MPFAGYTVPFASWPVEVSRHDKKEEDCGSQECYGHRSEPSLKVEGLSIVSARWVGRTPQLEINIVAVTDSDAKDLDTPSTLAKVEVVFRP